MSTFRGRNRRLQPLDGLLAQAPIFFVALTGDGDINRAGEFEVQISLITPTGPPEVSTDLALGEFTDWQLLDLDIGEFGVLTPVTLIPAGPVLALQKEDWIDNHRYIFQPWCSAARGKNGAWIPPFLFVCPPV